MTAAPVTPTASPLSLSPFADGRALAEALARHVVEAIERRLAARGRAASAHRRPRPRPVAEIPVIALLRFQLPVNL